MVRLVGAEKNILKVWERASGDVITEGSEWYPLARDIANDVGSLLADTLSSMVAVNSLLQDDNITLSGAGIISALSPQVAWDRNIYNAKYLAKTLSKPSFCTGVTYTKCMNIVDLASNSLVGKEDTYKLNHNEVEIVLGKQALKTKAFFNNIVNPNGDNVPTIDRHAISIWLNRKATEKELLHYGTTKGGYEHLTHCYKRVAEYLDRHYNEVQATTWIQWRIENRNKSMGDM